VISDLNEAKETWLKMEGATTTLKSTIEVADANDDADGPY
jgi:hypothetical protein